MRSSKPSIREEGNGLELAHGLAEASDTRASDEGILAAIHALRKDFSAQLQEVTTSNHGVREARYFLKASSIDQAFRLPKSAPYNANKPNLNPAPRVILVKFCWMIDRDRVMKAARKK